MRRIVYVGLGIVLGVCVVVEHLWSAPDIECGSWRDFWYIDRNENGRFDSGDTFDSWIGDEYLKCEWGPGGLPRSEHDWYWDDSYYDGGSAVARGTFKSWCEECNDEAFVSWSVNTSNKAQCVTWAGQQSIAYCTELFTRYKIVTYQPPRCTWGPNGYNCIAWGFEVTDVWDACYKREMMGDPAITVSGTAGGGMHTGFEIPGLGSVGGDMKYGEGYEWSTVPKSKGYVAMCESIHFAQATKINQGLQSCRDEVNEAARNLESPFRC